MVWALNNHCGFETGGNEEIAAVSGTPIVQSGGSIRTGTYIVECNASGEYAEMAAVDYGSDAGTGKGVGVAINVQVSTTAGTATIMDVVDASGNMIIQLQASRLSDTTYRLRVRDSQSTVAITGTTTLTEGVWYFVTLYWVNSGTGAAELFVDGNSEGTTSSADFDTGNTLTGYRLIRVGNPIDSVRFDDFFCGSGATGAGDVYKDFEVFKYQTAKASSVPDAGLGGSGGINLSTGPWSNVGETPVGETNIGVYSGNGGQQGTVDMATGAEIDGDSNIKAIKGIWRLQRSNGSPTDHFTGLGDSGDGNSAAETSRALDTAYANFFTGRDTNLPTSAQSIRQGFRKTSGGREIQCADMWAMLGHEPAASGTTIAMALGSFTLTGQVATVTKNTPVAMAAGAFTLNGQDLTVSFDVEVLMALASFSLSGLDPTITRHIPIAMAEGNITFTGLDFTLTKNTPVTMDVGSYTLNGLDPTVTRQLVVMMDEASFALTGLDPVVTRQLQIYMDAGAFMFTGLDFTIQVNTPIVMDEAIFALTGNDPTITRHIPIAMDTVNFTLTGLDATIAESIAIAMDLATFTLSGLDLTITLDHVIMMDLAPFTMTGWDASIARHIPIAMDEGLFAWSGLDLTLTRLVPILMDEGLMTFTGLDATFVRALKVNMDEAQAVLTGNDPVIARSLVVNMDAGAFTLTADNPNFVKHWVVNMDEMGFSFTGNNLQVVFAGEVFMDEGQFVFTGNDLDIILSAPAAGQRKQVNRPGWVNKHLQL